MVAKHYLLTDLPLIIASIDSYTTQTLKKYLFTPFHFITSVHFIYATLLLVFTMFKTLLSVHIMVSQINIQSIVVWYKNKNMFMVIICEDHVHCFWNGFSVLQMKYPYRVIIHSLILVIIVN